MSDLESRLRRLEQKLIAVPSADEYFDASNRERSRSLHMIAEWLAPYGFDGDYLFTEQNLRILSDDTQEQQEKDQQIIDACYTALGRDRTTEVEEAKEKLLARLEARS